MDVFDKNQGIEKKYWDEFYNNYIIEVPSQFCVSLATDNHRRKAVVEFGMGNGRDSLYLASQGYIVVAVDLSEMAVDACNLEMIKRSIMHAEFICGDITDEQTVSSAITTARKNSHADFSELLIYSRFVLHTLDKKQEHKFLTSLSRFMLFGDILYFEFRSEDDVSTEKHFGNTNHYRRYIASDEFINNMNVLYGFTILYDITGRGMAKYKEEDPIVTRIIAVKK